MNRLFTLAVFTTWLAAISGAQAVSKPPSNVITASTEAALREAIASLKPLQTIQISAGTYQLTKYLDIRVSNVAIIGSDNGTELICPGNSEAVQINNVNNVRLEKLTFRDCKEYSALYIYGINPITNIDEDYDISVAAVETGQFSNALQKDAILLRECVFVNNRQNHYTANYNTYGGAVRAYKCRLWIQDSKFRYNVASSLGGAVYLNDGVALIENSTFVNNIAGYGGAFEATSTVAVVIGSTFIGNADLYNGGAIYMDDKSLTVMSSIFQYNVAGASGGALYLGSGEIVVYKCQFNDNRAIKQGGAVSSGSHKSLAIYESVFSGNIAFGNSSTDNITVLNRA